MILELNYIKGKKKENGKRDSIKSLVKCNTCGIERIIEKASLKKGNSGEKCPRCSQNWKTIEDYQNLAKSFNIEFLGPFPPNTQTKTKWKCRCGTIFERTYGAVSRNEICCWDCRNKKLIKWTPERIQFLKDNYSKMEIDELSKSLGILKGTIFRKASQLKISMKKEHRYRNHLNKDDVSHIVNNIIDPKTAYTLGFLWADGWLVDKTKKRASYAINIKIVKSDFDNIKHILLPLVNWKIYTICAPERQITTQIHFSNKLLYEFLAQNDYLDKSGQSACKILSKIPDNLKFYWFLGLFDGDGHINKTSGGASISSSYEQNWQYLIFLSNWLKIPYRISKYIHPTKGHKGSSFIFNKKSSKIFLDYIYQDKTLCGLTRKYNKYKDFFLKTEKSTSPYILDYS